MPNKYTTEIKTLPLIPLRGISVFPHMVIHFDVGREKSINALEKAMLDDSLILLCTQIDPKTDEPTTDDFYHFGTIAKVKQMLKLPGGSIRVLIEGINRGRVLTITQEEPYIIADVEELTYLPEKIEIDKDIEADRKSVV